MIQTGTILKIKGRQAVIFTDQCDIVCIDKQPGMYEGLEIRFSSSEIINKRNLFVQYSPLVGSIAAVFIFAFLLFNSLYLSQHNVYAYIEVATNHYNLELSIDENRKVIDVKALDDSTEHLITNLELKSKSLENVLSDIFNKTDSLGLIKADAEFPILVARHITEHGDSEIDTVKLNAVCRKAVSNLTDKDITLYTIDVTHDDRELSFANNISMGRYVVYDTGIEQGISLTIEYVKTAKISEILEKINIENKFEIGDSDDNALVTNAPTPNISPTQNASITNTPITSTEPSRLPSNTSNKASSKPSPLPKNTPSKTTSKPSQLPKHTPSKATIKPSQLPKPSRDEDRLDVNLNVNYDISIIKAMEKEIEKAEKQIDSIKKNIESNINLEKNNAETRIEEIYKNADLDWNTKQEEINRIKSDLNNKIADFRKNEKELISNILENLYQKMDELAA
jgi:uncharacterized protein YukE